MIGDLDCGSPDTATLLAAAAEWRLVGLLFERPREGWLAEIEAVAHVVRAGVAAGGKPARLGALAAAAAASRVATQGEYLALLGPGGAVSPREVAYSDGEDPGKTLAGLKVFYDSFGYDPVSEDPPDHIAVEAGFMGYLHLKLAYALEAGDAEAQEVTREAIDRFAGLHLAPFARALRFRIETATDGYLSRAASSLEAAAPVQE